MQTVDGNWVNVNWNGDQLNVNNWNRNANPNIVSGSVRHFLLTLKIVLGGGMPPEDLVDLIHPPSMRPISSMICWSCVYFFRSIAFVSFARRTRIRRRLSCTLACSSGVHFISLFRCPARKSDSIIERHCSSVLCQSPCRSCLGTPLRKEAISL